MADETNLVVDTSSTGSDTGGIVDNSSTSTQDTGVDNSSITSTPENDEYSALENLYPADEPDADKETLTDPNIDPNAVSPEFSKVLGISGYVSEPAHVEAAINAASQLWDVSSGKAQASGLLEAMRESNPQGYEKMIREDVIPYIEHITGMKLGGSQEQATDDPIAKLQRELAEMKQAPMIEAQKRAQQEQLQKATTVTYSKLNDLAKGTYFEGKGDQLGPELLRQFNVMKLNPDNVMKEVLKGNTSNIEKAFKAIQKDRVVQVKEYNTWMIANSRKLKSALPASKTNPAGSVSTPGDDMSKWTHDQLAEYLRTGEAPTK